MSGVHHVEVSINGGGWKRATGTDTCTITFTDTIKSAKVRAEDNNGNKVEKTLK